MSKSSRISLYSSDNLDEKGCFLEALDAKFQIQSPNVFEFNAPSFALAGQTTSANDVADLGQKIADMVALQASDSATHTAGVATNVASISAEVVQRTADVAALSSTIGTETSARAASDTALQANIDAEQSARVALMPLYRPQWTQKLPPGQQPFLMKRLRESQVTLLFRPRSTRSV